MSLSSNDNGTQIRGPYPIIEQRLAVNESGSLLGFGDFEGKLSGSVMAPSGDVIVVKDGNLSAMLTVSIYGGW